MITVNRLSSGGLVLFRKVGFKKPNKGISNLKNVGSSDDEQLENELETLLDDEIDSYNAYKEQSLKSKPKPKKRHHSGSDEEKVQEHES